jgi:fucose permease
MIVPAGPRRPFPGWRRAAVERGVAVPAVVWLGLAAFIGLGLPEATLGVTWPSMRADFDHPLSAVGLLLVATTVGYLPTSALSGRLAARVGAGWMLIGASAVFAAAMILYLAAPSLPFLVAGSLLGGVAAGIIDPGINTYFALRHGTRTMNLLHASFGVGATAGPFIATVVIAAGGSWRGPYALYLAIQAALLAGFVATRRQWSSPPMAAAADSAPEPAAAASAVEGDESHASQVLALSVATFFVYTGLEVGAGVLAFTLLNESRGLTDTAAGLWATAFWAGLTIGRAALGLGGARLEPEQILRVSTLAALGSTLLIWIDPGGGGAVGFPLLGLSLAGMFPSLVLLTPRRVGPARTAQVMGLQFSVAAIGASGVPAAITLAADGHLERIATALVLLAVVVAVLDLVTTRLSRVSSGTRVR